MTAQEIVEAILDALNVIFSWPVVILILVFMFRKRVEEAIGALIGRLRSVSIGGATAEFAVAVEEQLPTPSLRKSARLSATSSRADRSEDMEYLQPSQEIEADDSSVEDMEISEFDQRIENLRE